MARRKSGERLEAKLEEARRLEAEIRQLKNKARDKKRAEEERRGKILGRVLLAEMITQPEGPLAQMVVRLLGDRLKGSERGLFPELPAITAAAVADEPTTEGHAN